MAISDRLNKLTTDITNAYTSIENKGGTIPANKNTNNLSTAIDSIEVIEQATAEGESISLANTKAMPYSDYVVEGKSEQGEKPSPSIPSEIHSVADDDINIFNAEKIENYGIKVKDNGKTIIMPLITSGNGNTNTNTTLSALCPDLQVGDVIYIRFKRNLNNNRNKFIYLYGSNRLLNASEDSPSYTITQEDLNSSVFLYGNDYDYGETEQCIIIDFKIQKNTIPINYSPYNQGTVTIKQENVKNYLDWDKFIDYSNWTNSNSPGYKSFEITGLNINKTYTLCRTDTAGYGETSKYAGFNKGNNNGNMFLHSTDSSRNLQSVSDTPSEDGKIYITMYMSSQSDLNDYINIIKNCWIIEGSEYQNYISYRKIFQTEPLRSLPNGVKDTIEAEQHRKIGTYIFDGTELWYFENSDTNRTVIRNERTISFNSDYYLSDKFIKGSTSNNRLVLSMPGVVYMSLDNSIVEIESSDSNEVKLQKVKTWLSNNPVTVLYPLAEETIEPLTQNQATTMLDIIKTGSYEGTTNIYTDEDVKPKMKAGYYKKG